MSYVISIDGEEREGPFRLEELEQKMISGTIDGSTLVWEKGMRDWASLKSVDALKHLIDIVPPPLQSTPPPLQPQKKAAEPSEVDVKTTLSPTNEGEDAVDNKYFLDGGKHYLANTFKINNEYITGWGYLGGLFTRVFPVFLVESYLLQGATFFVVSFWLELVLGAKRARAVGGREFMNRIITLDIFFFVMPFAVFLILGFGKVTGAAGILSGLVYVATLIYGIWSRIVLCRDSTSLDKGGAYCLLQYLKPNTPSKQKALLALLENVDRLKAEVALPEEVALTVSLVSPDKRKIAMGEYGNEFYYLCCLSNRQKIGIKDWPNASSLLKGRLFKKEGQYKEIDQTLKHLESTVRALSRARI